MEWLNTPVVIDGRAAAVIAAGMRTVARADGEVHPREVALIEAFSAKVPKDAGDVGAATALQSQDLRETYVRSLLLVALADGVISDEEDRVIRALAEAVEVDPPTIDRLSREVKQWFLDQFSGVQVFRESVEQIAAELGIDSDAD